MNQITSVTPEANPELLEKFEVQSEPMVHKLLNTMFNDEHEMYVFTKGSGNHFVSEILEIDWDQSVMWMGTPYDKSLASDCNANTPYTLVSFPDGVKVQFSGIGLVHTNFQGAEALRLSLPKKIVRLQLRNFFRVMADDELNRQVSLSIPTLPGPESLVDISLAGCGLLLRNAHHLQIGDVLSDVRVNIPDGEGSMLVDLEVRNKLHLQDNPEIMQVGCEMRLQKRADERRLQRFLLNTERRQRAARHSID